MKKRYLFPVLAIALMFAGCDYNEKNFEGLDEMSKPTDVFTKSYTLTEADYASISSNKTNIALAKDDGVEKELAALKTTMCFTDALPASKYLPAFLAAKWLGADSGSAVKVTYKMNVGQPAYITALNTATIYKVTKEDYESVWGAAFPFFSPAETAQKHVPGILAKALPDAKTGDIVLVDYNQSANEPGGSVVALNESFENYWTEAVNVAEVTGWHNVTTVGTYSWNGKIFSNNSYIQASAYKHTGALEVYMISPLLSITNGMSLAFDACYGNYTKVGGRLSVLVSENLGGFTKEDIAAAKWDDISSSVSIPVPTGSYGTLGNVCNHDLSAYKGKKVYVAFRYNGDSTVKDEDGKFATTTVQVDNVVIKSEGNGAGDDVYEATNGLYSFNGTAWSVYTAATSLDKADFKLMGSNYDNFSATMNPDNYLPKFLSLTYPFAQEDNVKAVAYKYFASSVTSVKADEYAYTSGAWVKNTAVETVTDQFVYSGGKWNFDPSTTITLPVVKNDPTSVLYYQTITDWVKENHSEYVTSYGNNDYYFGGSAYNNNFDFRPSAWKTNVPTVYGNMSDDELTKLMWERLPESFIHALEKLHADAAPIDGLDVFYTFNFGIYNGSSTTTWTIQYKVIAKGKFEYVIDSLKEVK
ncbi:choice-of-anchor J domain-containing protein [uncultured Bacteroides sp.]|uniref:choice-of-anchor J domain-containing protein n=1 Tax=uncultured Bacteroides sp. TaxID=162156 RepID=UPI0025D67FBE|nr:choice-of-anchor J domain-containing protein [uncultured Bacteroides sp.]